MATIQNHLDNAGGQHDEMPTLEDCPACGGSGKVAKAPEVPAKWRTPAVMAGAYLEGYALRPGSLPPYPGPARMAFQAGWVDGKRAQYLEQRALEDAADEAEDDDLYPYSSHPDDEIERDINAFLREAAE